jgi:hypothetical protein
MTFSSFNLIIVSCWSTRRGAPAAHVSRTWVMISIKEKKRLEYGNCERATICFPNGEKQFFMMQQNFAHLGLALLFSPARFNESYKSWQFFTIFMYFLRAHAFISQNI